MSSCWRMTVKERIQQAEAGDAKLSKEARKAIELSLAPAPYICTGAKVGSLAGTKVGRIRRRRRKAA